MLRKTEPDAYIGDWKSSVAAVGMKALGQRANEKEAA